MLAEIFYDDATLSDDNRLICTLGLDGDDWRLSQGMNSLQLERRKLCTWVAVEDFEFVWRSKGFEEPENALGAGLLEPFRQQVRIMRTRLEAMGTNQ